MIKRKSTIFLQGVTLFFGILILAILIRFPSTEGRAKNLDLFSIYTDPFILFGYVSSIPFFIALFNAIKLFGFFGKNDAFSLNSVKASRNIKNCAILFCVLVLTGGGYIRIFHNKEDDPAGFLALAFVISILSIIVAITFSIIESILQNGINLKSENENLIKQLIR